MQVAREETSPSSAAASLSVKLFLLECHLVRRISIIPCIFSSVNATVRCLVFIRYSSYFLEYKQRLLYYLSNNKALFLRVSSRNLSKINKASALAARVGLKCSYMLAIRLS